MKKPISLEIHTSDDTVIFNIVFKETGEIRQKRRSKDWVLKRIFSSELKTWFKNQGEDLELKDLEFWSLPIRRKNLNIFNWAALLSVAITIVLWAIRWHKHNPDNFEQFVNSKLYIFGILFLVFAFAFIILGGAAA